MKLVFLFLLLPAVALAKSPPTDYREPPPDPPGSGAIANAPPIPYRLTPPGPFQNLPAIDESHPVPLPPVKQPYWSFGKLDPVLTEACRLGEFASQPINRIELNFVGDTGRARMQVVPPLYRNLLIDRRKLAKPGVTYYFLDTALPDCEVRVDSTVKLNAFAPGRTSALPLYNPKALAARKALIKSWPGS